MEITFETLPKAVSGLYERLDSIERLILNKNPADSNNSEEILTVQQAADFLRIGVQTVYHLVSKREIPSMKKGKRLYFSKIELTEWIRQRRKKTNLELGTEAELYLKNKKRSNNGK